MWLVKGFTFDEVNVISVVKRNGNIVDITTLEDMLLAGSKEKIEYCENVISFGPMTSLSANWKKKKRKQ